MDAPTIADFKTNFSRDFPYGTTNSTVKDFDITKALNEAGFNINESLFGTQDSYSMAYLYLAAHYLVMDLRASSQGISGAFGWLESGKSVGSVSQSFSIPQKILDNPVFAYYSKTNYGAKYLSLVLPRLVAPISIAAGGTLP